MCLYKVKRGILSKVHKVDDDYASYFENRNDAFQAAERQIVNECRSKGLPVSTNRKYRKLSNQFTNKKF